MIDNVDKLRPRMMSVAYRIGSVADAERAARILAGVLHKKWRDDEMHPATVNGAPGVVFTRNGQVVHVVSVRIEQDVKAVYITVNLDKLARWSIVKID
jgi:RNA polymerase sigma-70 factor (ECF subfamily)